MTGKNAGPGTSTAVPGTCNPAPKYKCKRRALDIVPSESKFNLHCSAAALSPPFTRIPSGLMRENDGSEPLSADSESAGPRLSLRVDRFQVTGTTPPTRTPRPPAPCCRPPGEGFVDIRAEFLGAH